MALDKALVDYSYSPSDGSKIELIDLASTRPSSQISAAGSNLSWHPKLTLYRLLVILSTVGLVVAKSVTSYLNLTSASITFEWILGVVVFLFFHVLGVYEETRNPYFSSLFNFDCMEYLWAFLENLPGFSRPYYISDEIDPRHQAPEIHPPVTGYRILVTLVVASIGMTKSALLYGQEPMEATTVECLFGVGIVTALYCLGLYEASSIKVYPKFFHVDYSAGLSFTETVIVVLHLFGFLFCGAISYGFYLLTAIFESPAKNRMEPIEPLVITAAGILTGILSLSGAIGISALLYNLGRRYLASPLGQFIVGLPAVRLIPYVHQKYWLPSAVSLRPRPRFFYLKRLIVRQSIKIPLGLYRVYLMMVVLMCCVCLFLAWYFLFRHLLEEAPWYGLLIYFFISLSAVPALLAGIAVTIHDACKDIIGLCFNAWKDFTVDVEPPV